MSSPSVRALGAYRVLVTPELLAEAMELKYDDEQLVKVGGAALSAEERQAVEQAVRQELSSVVLLEVQVQNVDSRFSMDDFAQPNSDQAPYDEVYLTSDGQAVLGRGGSQPPGESVRLAFFLHFYDPSKPLLTSYGPVAVPPLQGMPDRLAVLAPYEPVD